MVSGRISSQARGAGPIIPGERPEPPDSLDPAARRLARGGRCRAGRLVAAGMLDDPSAVLPAHDLRQLARRGDRRASCDDARRKADKTVASAYAPAGDAIANLGVARREIATDAVESGDARSGERRAQNVVDEWRAQALARLGARPAVAAVSRHSGVRPRNFGVNGTRRALPPSGTGGGYGGAVAGGASAGISTSRVRD